MNLFLVSWHAQPTATVADRDKRPMPTATWTADGQADRMHRTSAGTSLVESLVALSVFSIGSACTATWLAWSIETDAKASRSIVGTTLAASMLERLRANPDGVAGGHYRDALASSSGCETGCDIAALAADDMHRFRASLKAQMGERADGSVRCGTAGECVIRIAWRDRDDLVWTVRP